MKILLKIILLIGLPVSSIAQGATIDSLKNILANSKSDSISYRACKFIYDHYEETNRDSAFHYAKNALLLAQKNNKKLAEIHSLDNKAYQLVGLGRYAEALQYLLEAFKIAEDRSIEKEKTWILFASNPSYFTGNNRLLMLAYTHHIFGILMWQTDNNEQSIIHFGEARKISSEIHHSIRQLMANMNLGRSYLFNDQFDSALVCEKEAERLAIQTGFKKYLGQVYSITANIYEKKNDKLQAKQYYLNAIKTSKEQNNLSSLSFSYYGFTKFYLSEGEKDSALYYAMRNLETIQQLGPVTGLTVNPGTVYENVYLSYKLREQPDSLFKYQGLTLAVKDSLYKIRIKNLTDLQNVALNEQLRLKNLEKDKIAFQNKIRTWVLLAGIGVLLLLAIIFYVNNRQKHKDKLKIEQAYHDLKATQQQLVQSEKMASLGELTAGIAHEIQNPLNFVNNFSEVNDELVKELSAEADKGNLEEVKAIAKDIAFNSEKINHHGKRADAIVKGMLQHSRTSSGQKEPTDINALADEYLRLAYHGLRAKDKSFNADIKTDFDNSIGKIKIIPQDIGRVVLNLINNAFYAVDEKKKQNLNGYEPTVSVSTKKMNGKVEISVKDNGNGIPQKVLDKIFQPFFTTKPTGQGTGLGLSLSYDIIKAHGGELKVETKEREGSAFIIQLPINNA
jgi:two-component system NtrC family sensor kinase